MSNESGLASGIRVVEIGSSAAVAVAGMVLADAGAEVILIEPPGGNPLRQEPAFEMWGRGKQSVVADLHDEGGRTRALQLIQGADVLLIGLRPASLDRLGLGYAALAEDAPQLIHVALSGFGSNGPFRDIPVYDAVMQARGGRMYEFSTLFDGARPAFPAAPVVSHGAAMACLMGVFSALRERERNGGRGQSIETSLAQALCTYDMLHWVPGGPTPLRFEDVPFVPYTVARTADGVWLQFAQNGPALFADFLRVLDLDGEIAYADAMMSPDGEVKRGIRERIQARIREDTFAGWQSRFADEHNLSAERFWAPGEALSHPQFEAIGDTIEVTTSNGEVTRQLGPLFDIPDHPLVPGGPAPPLGSGDSGGIASRPAIGPSGAASDLAGEGTPGLLAGITVLELGMWIALPFAGSQLADLGARVIKLEPLGGDPMRGAAPFGFKMVQGKESIALDLKQPQATEIVHKLVAQADVVIHSYRPGVPERLGIDFATLRGINPKLVYLYNGSYGSRGPKSYAPAFHVTGGAVSGGAWAQAGAGCPPGADADLDADEMARISRRLELANEANPDFNSAVAAAAAVTLGLYARERTGQGIEIETRMMLSNAMMMSADFIEAAESDAASSVPSSTRELDADLTGLSPLYRLYEAAEGWVFLAAPRDRDFERLCEALDLAPLASDARFGDEASRGTHAEALAAALGDVFAKRSADDWERALTEHGVACVRADQGPYRSWVFEQPWAREQGLIVDVPDSEVGPYTRYGPPLTSRERVSLKGAFKAGANSRALLEEIGLGTTEVDALIEAGIVVQAETGDRG